MKKKIKTRNMYSIIDKKDTCEMVDKNGETTLISEGGMYKLMFHSPKKKQRNLQIG